MKNPLRSMKYAAISHFVLAATLIVDMIVYGPRLFQLIATPVLIGSGISYLFYKKKPGVRST